MRDWSDWFNKPDVNPNDLAIGQWPIFYKEYVGGNYSATTKERNDGIGATENKIKAKTKGQRDDNDEWIGLFSVFSKAL